MANNLVCKKLLYVTHIYIYIYIRKHLSNNSIHIFFLFVFPLDTDMYKAIFFPIA